MDASARKPAEYHSFDGVPRMSSGGSRRDRYPPPGSSRTPALLPSGGGISQPTAPKAQPASPTSQPACHPELARLCASEGPMHSHPRTKVSHHHDRALGFPQPSGVQRCVAREGVTANAVHPCFCFASARTSDCTVLGGQHTINIHDY